jgi:hypothetical protein
VDMYYNPHTHLEIARARHEDLLRDAERARRAAAFKSERPGLIARLHSLLGNRTAKQPVVRPA